MRAGLLNKRARFEAITRLPDGAGGYTEQWDEFATVWAQFSPERARERIQQGRLADNSAGVLRVRSSIATRQITQVHRVVVGGTIYNIRSSDNPDQHNDMLEFTVETDGTQG